MKPHTVACLAFVLFTLPGCKTIVSDHLIGVPIAAEDAQMYEGVWQMDDGIFHVKHTEGANLVMASLEWSDGEFEVNKMDMVITSLGDARFLQIVMDEDEDDGGEADDDDADDDEDGGDELDDAAKPWVIFGLITGSEEQAIVISAPNFDRFVQALEADSIEGEVDDDGNTLHIHGDKGTLDALIDLERLHELFNLQEPVVITRIAD